ARAGGADRSYLGDRVGSMVDFMPGRSPGMAALRSPVELPVVVVAAPAARADLGRPRHTLGSPVFASIVRGDRPPVETGGWNFGKSAFADCTPPPLVRARSDAEASRSLRSFPWSWLRLQPP